MEAINVHIAICAFATIINLFNCYIFYPFAFVAQCSDDYVLPGFCGVVGNIHDNPELLEGGE